MNLTADKMDGMTPKNKTLAIVGGAIAVLIIVGLATGEGQPKATPTTVKTSTPAATTTSRPPAKPDPTGEQITQYVARGTGHPDLDTACAAGIRWTCNVEQVTPRGGTLEVRVRKLENPDGDSVARGWYNFVTAGNDSPMPDLHYVQITTANDGAVGEHRKPY